MKFDAFKSSGVIRSPSFAAAIAIAASGMPAVNMGLNGRTPMKWPYQSMVAFRS